MGTPSRWESALCRKLEAVKSSGVKEDLTESSYFDDVFGKQIEETMSEYRLMVAELISIKLWLRRVIHISIFILLSIGLLISFIFYSSYKTNIIVIENNERLDNVTKKVIESQCALYILSNGKFPGTNPCLPGG